MSAGSPRISIVMPVLNGEKFLHETLATIFQQTFTDWELVVADGASTDGTLKILAEYQKQYPNIHVSSEAGDGAYHAIYRGARRARGEFIFLLAVSDGYLDKEWFRKCVEVMDKDPEVSLVWGIPREVSEYGEDLGPNFMYARFLEEADPNYRAIVVKNLAGRIDLHRPSSLLHLLKKIHPANLRSLFHMVRRERVPQKREWFRYWLKTGIIFPDGNMCVSHKAFMEFLPPHVCGSGGPGDWMEFYFNFNANGYLAYCIPVLANFGRHHGGQVSEVFENYLDQTRRAYFRKLDGLKAKLKKNPEPVSFKDRAGRPIEGL